ncbi:hypothetical protein [Salicibibacter kimchii]|uniref:Uncharacterized protein n=1 Tax=Salicibibacter kimchii TaxID=2099786 RepID=A0A345BUG7_9BACI|nr:hypothetical protein [Salicibibacter kimchii]AXF54598.1 hypothetical protein DT065_00245 [Salicibibacter kimchii]
MNGNIYELYQHGKLIMRGNKRDLSEKTKLSMSTIDKYCTPGYLESTKNETQTKVIKVNGDRDA